MFLEAKLKIEEILANKTLMDYFVGFYRDSYNLHKLFEYYEVINFDEISDRDSTLDFHPYYTHIAEGEYGNSVLVLYRSKIIESDELLKSLKLNNPYSKAAYQDYLEEKKQVLGMYSYQHKGIIITEWFEATLKENIQFEIKKFEIKEFQVK